MLRYRLLGLAALFFSLVVCGGCDLLSPPKSVPTSITLSAGSLSFAALGLTQQLTATIKDQNGRPMRGAAVSWASSDVQVATVSSSGLVTSTGNGMATITASSGAASGTVLTTVQQITASMALTPSSVSFASLGETQQLTATVKDANDHAMPSAAVSWGSSNAQVATVSSSGLVTSVGNGAATITAASGAVSATASVGVQQAATSLALMPSSLSFGALGDTARVAARVNDAGGAAVFGITVTWSTSDAQVATVSSNGLVAAVTNGTAWIRAAAAGLADSAKADVKQVAAALGMVTQPAGALQGKPFATQPVIEVQDQNGHRVVADSGRMVTAVVSGGSASVSGGSSVADRGGDWRSSPT